MAWVAVAVGGASLVSGYLGSQAAGRAADSQTNAANRANDTQLQMYNQTRDDQTQYRQAGNNALDILSGRQAGYGDLQKKYDTAISNRENLVNLIKGSGGQTDARWGPGAEAYNKEAEGYRSQLDAMGPQLSGAQLGQNIMSQDPGYQFRLDQGNKSINAAASARGRAVGGATMKELTRYGSDYASSEYGNAYNRLAAMAGIGQTANAQSAQNNMNYGNQYGQNQSNIGNAQAAGEIGQANAINSAIGNGANTYMTYNWLKGK